MSPHEEEQPISPGGNGDAALKVQVKPVRRTRLPSLKRLSSRLKVHKSDNPPVVPFIVMIEEDCPDEFEESIPNVAVGTVKPTGAFFSRLLRPTNKSLEVKGNVITDTFKRRECCKFVTRSALPQDQKWCKCGHHDNEHSQVHCKQSFSHTADWNPTNDTKRFPTNAYGEIDFLNAENDVLPLYLRCDMDAKVEDLGNLLLKMWGIPRPNLLISVFGGHSKFDSKKMGAESEIKEGLVKAAKDSKAWVFTSGVDHGVSNLVGDAVAMKRSFVNSIPVIGVNSWGAVYNNHELEEEEEQGRFPAFYQAVSQSELERDDVTKKPKSMVLEHEHTHFILLDFGTKNNFHEDEVRKFRITLQEHLREITEAQLVSVLIEGGSGSLEEAHVRIMRGLPVVVLGDSGRISNVISLAVDLVKHAKLLDGSISPLKNDDRLKVRQSLIEALPDFEESKYDELMEIVEEIISQEKLVTVWRYGKGVDLDTAILEGLMKSIANLFPDIEENQSTPTGRHPTLDQKREKQRERAKSLMKKQLELAIQWNRLDIAKDFIFESKSDNSKEDLIFTEGELNDMLGLAIQHQQTSFIRFIIKDREANIKTFLTMERFEAILRTNTPENTLLYSLLQKKCENPANWKFEHFEMVIHDISEGVFKVPGKTKPSENLTNSLIDPSVNSMLLKAIKRCVTTCTKGCQCSYKLLEQHANEAGAIQLEEGTAEETRGNEDSTFRGIRDYDFEDPASLLTVYMVMIHQQDMAMVFWECSQTSLFLCLVCTCIHRWMCGQKSDSLFITDSLSDHLQTCADDFVDISNKVLEEVALYKTEHVIALVNFKFEKWGGKTILEMAHYVNAIEIIAHPTIQDYIDLEWNGWLDSDISTFRTIISLVCPLVASFRNVTPFDKWKTKNIRNDGQKSRNRLQDFIQREGHSHNPDPKTEKNEKLDILTKLKYFYKAPVVKFWIYTITYMAFLFSYVCALLLEDKNGTCTENNHFRQMFGCKLTMSQQFTYIWVFCLIPLEIRQIHFSYPTTLIGKFKMYFSSFYNICDALCIGIIMLALAFKMMTRKGDDEENIDMTVGENMFRLLFAFAFILFCMKLCQALEKSEQIGPKVMMITKMLKDLQFFIFLITIFVIGYGVSTTSIIYPHKFQNFTSSIMFDIVWRPYQNMFGEIGDTTLIKTMNEAYCKLQINSTNSSPSFNKADCENGLYDCFKNDNKICMYNVYIVKTLLAAYMMLAAVLMLNLMVAVFTSTYENIQEDYKSHWKRQKFDLMIEYRSRSPLPVPFSTILHCWRFVMLVYRFTFGRFNSCCRSNVTEKIPANDVHQRLTITLLEIECRRNYLEKMKDPSKHERLKTEISKLSSEVEHIDRRLEDFETKMQKVIDIAQPQYEYPDTDSVFQLQDSISELPSYSGYGMDSEATDQNMSVITEDVPADFAESADKRRSSNISCKSQLHVWRLTKMGKKSRKLKYPGEKNVRRSMVREEHWDWRKLLLSYEPLEHTDPSVPSERKLSEIKWHRNAEGDERRSYEGRYEIRNQLPLIPCGRTGLSGRGQFEKFGPNHAALPIITRYAKEDDGGDLVVTEKPVLEVLLDFSRGESLFLPEIKGVYDDLLPNEVRELLTSENQLSGKINHDKLLKRINKILKVGILIHKGFIDNEYNTDNSWSEGIFVSYHDGNDNAFRYIDFPEDSQYRWSRINSWRTINSQHREYLQRAFYARNGSDCSSAQLT